MTRWVQLGREVAAGLVLVAGYTTERVCVRLARVIQP